MQQNQQSSSSAQPWGGPFPSLHMWPLHETFSTKMLYLPESQRIKIGRQTSNKTIPGERNAFFDSKVLSRLHAEVWEQGGKIYIKDIKSSNGTFINNERLSPEGVESEPFELKSEDLVEFGIDIVSDDNRTIVHHKVAAKVYCVFNADDAALSARELANYPSQHRRPAAPPNAGPSVPAVMSAGGKPNGLNFDAVLSKLRDELSKSKETGAELQELAGSMTDIQETLGGGLPPSQNGSAAAYMPLQFRSNSAEAKAALAGPHGQQAAAFIALQNQLSDTQNSLNAHIERIKTLETGLHQNESIKAEVVSLREQMEENKREIDMMVSGSRGRTLNRRIDDDDDDDTRSVVTIMDNEDTRERIKEITPEGNDTPSREDIKVVSAQNAELATKVEGLSLELTEAVRISRTLQSQHDEAMTAVRTLTERIGSLETGIASRIAEAVSESDKRWETWRMQIEDGWKKERESWEAERERLRSVVRDWEETSRRAVEENEDRALNERLSGEESSDDEKRDSQKPNGRSSRKPKRRRPSAKTSLAVRALRDITNDGSSTPTQTPIPLKASSELLGGGDVDVDDGVASALSDKSSESGKESVATLRDKDAGKRRARQAAEARQRNAVPVFTVVVVAVIASALYFRHKD